MTTAINYTETTLCGMDFGTETTPIVIKKISYRKIPTIDIYDGKKLINFKKSELNKCKCILYQLHSFTRTRCREVDLGNRDRFTGLILICFAGDKAM